MSVMDYWLDGNESTSQPREIHGVTLNIAMVPVQRSTITDLAWVDGTLFVAGLSNEEFSSRLRQVAYPFDGSATGTSVEIFHVDHGKYETQSPIRALTSFDGGSSILATYTCTPVVQFSLDELRGEGLVRGRTVAELGPMNQPFSLVSYDRDGEEFLLVSNTRHPLLKIPAASVAGQDSLAVPASEPGCVSRGSAREPRARRRHLDGEPRPAKAWSSFSTTATTPTSAPFARPSSDRHPGGMA